MSVDEDQWLAERFEKNRARLRAVAYRMLGSLSDADDAVQEAWLRLSRSGSNGVENLSAWLTTVVGRVCLDMIRARTARQEEPLGVHVPDPIVSRHDEFDPEQEALTADSVGLALLVVLDTLAPAERLSFVLHDMFGVPFDQIAAIVGRSPNAARLLASRARRRVRRAAAMPDADLGRQREVVGAFLAASRHGDFDALVALLDPDVVVRGDWGAALPGASREVRGAAAVAEQALTFSRLVRYAQPALVNGTPGIVVTRGGQLSAVMGFTVRNAKIIEVDILADPARLRQLQMTVHNE
jgi:RNA polymerase sigma factor (sigma-70 family)